MRARQVVRLCVPLLLVWQRRVGAMPRARIALRRRRPRACNRHKIICGCISLVNDVGDASFCIGFHSYAVSALLSRHALLFGSHGCECIFYRGRQKTCRRRAKAPRVSPDGRLSSLRQVVLTY